MKEQLGGIDRKMTKLQSESNQHGTDIERLFLLIDEKEAEGSPEESEEDKNRRNKLMSEHKAMKEALEDLRKKLEELDRREENDVKDLKEWIEALRQEIEELKRTLKANETQSRTSIDDERSSHKKPSGNNDLI